jgi:tetratricopeptide (TPR) repeat protein
MEDELNRPAAAASPDPSFDIDAFSPSEEAPSVDVGAGFGSPFGSGFSSPEPPQAAPHVPSFIVDGSASDAPASGAQASDFGFTFEEEQPKAAAKPAGGSFDFNSPFGGGIGEANTFDFATASVETTADDKVRIDRYLQEGDAAFAESEYQKAIDIWSRVFLIDVTNEEASQRIEKARAKRQEVDRRIEDLVVAGTLAFEKRDLPTARAKFQDVLALDPNHFNAREYLDRIDAGPAEMDLPIGRPQSADEDYFDDLDAGPGLRETPLVPPDPGGVAKAKASQAKKDAGRKKSQNMVLPIVAAAVIALGAGGYFAYTKFFAGNTETIQPSSNDVFAKADRLAAHGKFDEAIAALLTIRSDDPAHDRALVKIDDVKRQKAAASGMINGRPATEVYAEYAAKGKAAFGAHDYVTAKQQFEQAMGIQALADDSKAMYDAANQQVAKLDSAILLLKEGRYPDAIANLESLAQQDPQNESVRQLMQKAHFNYSISLLQQDNTRDGIAELDQVLRTNPNDTEARRARELAAKYDGQPKDLMYKIYVKYLPARGV